MSCEEHDRLAASSQFITHTVGRVLGRMGLQGTPINTKAPPRSRFFFFFFFFVQRLHGEHGVPGGAAGHAGGH